MASLEHHLLTKALPVIHVDHAAVTKPESPSHRRLWSRRQPHGHHAVQVVIDHLGGWRSRGGDRGKAHPMRDIDGLDESIRPVSIDEVDLIARDLARGVGREGSDPCHVFQIHPHRTELRIPPPQFLSIGFESPDQDLTILEGHRTGALWRLQDGRSDPEPPPIGPATLRDFREIGRLHLDDRAIALNGGRALRKGHGADAELRPCDKNRS